MTDQSSSSSGEGDALSAFLLEESPEIVAILTVDGQIVACSRGAAARFGRPGADLRGQSVSSLIAAEDQLTPLLQAMMRAAEHGEHRFTRVGADPQGRPVQVDVHLRRIAEPGGRTVIAVRETFVPAAVPDAMIDVDRSQRIALVNNQTERMFRSLLEAAPDAMVLLGKDGRIALVNAQAEILFGYQRHELTGQPIEILVPERFRPGHPEKRGEYFVAPRARPMGAGLDLFGRRKDGSEFAAEISLSPIETVDGTMVTAAIRDVTGRKRDMEEQTHRMQEANRLKSEFLANMSHELRTPLNAVIGFAALMHAGKAGPLSETQHEYLGDILGSSRHLLQLINDVLDLAKVESGRVELRLEPVDLPRLARETKDILRGLAAEKRIRMIVEVSADFPTVVVDPRLIKQVLYNYLSNAIKFTPESGRVVLRVRLEGDDMFQLQVEDSGIGIRPEDMARLFIEFQQLDSGPAKRFQGTGLGLALTKRIVEAQGGRVQASSVLGQGSTFSATLPREVHPHEHKLPSKGG